METSKTARGLFEETLVGDDDDDAPWAAVGELQRRNSPEVFQLAAEFCGSNDPVARTRGLQVLAQLGGGKPMPERPHFDESVSIALRCLNDGDSRVVAAAAWALAHLSDDRAKSALINLRSDADADVRHAVAVGVSCSERPDAIQTLIELMEDVDDDVRNWATFGLAQQCNVDSPEIRDALRKRLSDSFEDARDEGIYGLALRKDYAALRRLIDRLQAEKWIENDAMIAVEILNLFDDRPVQDLCDGLRAILESQA